MPKKARFVRTNSVKGGPRSKGGGTRNNGPNCLIMAMVMLAFPIAAVVGVLAFVVGVIVR